MKKNTNNVVETVIEDQAPQNVVEALNTQNKKQKEEAVRETLSLPMFFARASLIIAVIFLITYMLTVVTSSTDFFTGSAEGNALVGFADDLSSAEQLTQYHYDALYEIAEKLKFADSQEVVSSVLLPYVGSDEFGNIVYHARGTLVNADGTLFADTHSGIEQIEPLVNGNEQGCSEIYRDFSGYDCIAFFVPVRGSSYVDGLISVIPARDLFDLDSALGDSTTVALLIDRNGRIMASAKSSLFDSQIHSDLHEFIASLANDNAEITALNEAIATAQSSNALPLTGESARYTVAFAPLTTLDSHYLLLTLTDSDTLITEETVYIRHIITLVVIALVSLAIGGFFAIAYYRKMQAALDEATYLDPIVGCPNLKQFKDVAGAMLMDKQKQFAVCVLEIRGFRSLSDEIGTNESVELLKHVAHTLESYCLPRECFAYFGDGRFLQLIAYTGEASIRDRVRLIETMTAKHPALIKKNEQKPFNVGAGLTELGVRESVELMIEHAAVACDVAANHITASYQIYSSAISAEHERNAHIEAEMESALEDGAFKLFLQPKYDVVNDCIDSAEGLVRWFDPRTGDYRFPGEFISLFETNGFITKLDHFMYIETLKLLRNGLDRGDHVVPIATNVSAVTLNIFGFLDFYIDNKKKYEIPDGLIIIEFPENAVSEDFGRFAKIVERLHRNGIRCSVDDFGNGKGSLGVLKNIPLDELKLSRMFMRQGIDANNDTVLLSTMVTLAKSLGMRVVQEGVENKEMCDIVAGYGCDAIQGYYYAKAISAEEYRLFVNSNTSISFKSLVK